MPNNNPPVIVTHNSDSAHKAFSELDRLLESNPAFIELFQERFRLIQDLIVYKRISTLRANHCTAGFQPTGEFLEFLAALRKSKKLNPDLKRCCSDCKLFENYIVSGPKCLHKTNILGRDIVTGRTLTKISPYALRQNIDACGPKGKWFKPKQ